MPGKRQTGRPSLLVTFLLLRASCPPPFGPASLFVRAPSADVATQEEGNSRRLAARKLLLVTTSVPPIPNHQPLPRDAPAETPLASSLRNAQTLC